MRTANGRSNSVLIPRPACIGADDDNYFSYHYSKLSAMASDGVDMPSHSLDKSTVSEKSPADISKSSECCCPAGSQCKHDRLASCQVYKFRRSVCYAVRFWIRQFPVHFDLDAKLSALIKDWQRWLAVDDRSGYPELASFIDLGCLPSYDWIRNISVRDPSVKHCRKVSLVFNHLEPSELAKHLTYLEHRIMRRISVSVLQTSSLEAFKQIPKVPKLFNQVLEVKIDIEHHLKDEIIWGDAIVTIRRKTMLVPPSVFTFCIKGNLVRKSTSPRRSHLYISFDTTT